MFYKCSQVLKDGTSDALAFSESQEDLICHWTWEGKQTGQRLSWDLNKSSRNTCA